MQPKDGAKILLFDIETAPIIAHVWGTWDQNISLGQIKCDWHLLSWAAKWLDAPATHIKYMDQRNAKKIDDDKEILKEIWKLLDEADIVITQNGKSFDSKKLNARFIIQGMNPPSPYRHIDTKILAKRHFSFTSNKLEYLTDKLCKKFKKLKHKKFPGHELWAECLRGNSEAWNEMERYNKHDVLALEELYHRLAPWDASINMDAYREDEDIVCTCGSMSFQRRGYCFSNNGKYSRFVCKSCGKWTRGKTNYINSSKKASMRCKL